MRPLVGVYGLCPSCSVSAMIGTGNGMATYLSVEEARPLSGLRLAVTAHVPGIWSEAAKGLFDAKKIPYVLVEQVVGGENKALRDWTAQTSGPVAVWNDERPRSSWLELIYLAERLAPAPAADPAQDGRPDPHVRSLQ